MACVSRGGQTDVDLPYLPLSFTLKGGRAVVLDRYKQHFESELHEILYYIVNEEGNSYAQEDISNVEDFRKFYLSHDVFIVHDKDTNELLGAFYIKPNFPGRCSHICNGGFAAKKTARGLGIGSFMMKNYLVLARHLGYRASLFNLVFATNKASLGLCRKFGFKEIGVIPEAGNLKGLGYIDAYQFYMDLSKLPQD